MTTHFLTSPPLLPMFLPAMVRPAESSSLATATSVPVNASTGQLPLPFLRRYFPAATALHYHSTEGCIVSVQKAKSPNGQVTFLLPDLHLEYLVSSSPWQSPQGPQGDSYQAALTMEEGSSGTVTEKEVKELRKEVEKVKGLLEKEAMDVINLKNTVEEVQTQVIKFAKIEEIQKEVKELSTLAKNLPIGMAEDFVSLRIDVSTMKQEMCEIMSKLIKAQEVLNGSGAVNNQVELEEGMAGQNRAEPSQVQEVQEKSLVEGTKSEDPKIGWKLSEDSVEERQVQEAIEKSFLEQRRSQELSRKEMYERLTMMYSEKHPESLMQLSEKFEGRSAELEDYLEKHFDEIPTKKHFVTQDVVDEKKGDVDEKKNEVEAPLQPGQEKEDVKTPVKIVEKKAKSKSSLKKDQDEARNNVQKKEDVKAHVKVVKDQEDVTDVKDIEGVKDVKIVQLKETNAPVKVEDEVKKVKVPMEVDEMKAPDAAATHVKEELQVGRYCQARWKKDQTWYNAKILEVLADGVKVKFSNYGNKATVGRDEVVWSPADIPEGEAVDSHVATASQDKEFSLGRTCQARWREDSTWYNAEILAVQKNGVKVKFIDYGNEAMVGKKEVVWSPLSIPEGEAVDCNVAVVTEEEFSLGRHCQARWQEDCTWYNAEILAVQGDSDSVTVRFTDYGNEAVVGRKEVVWTPLSIPDGEMVDENVIKAAEKGNDLSEVNQEVKEDEEIEMVLSGKAVNLEKIVKEVDTGEVKKVMLNKKSKEEDIPVQRDFPSVKPRLVKKIC